MTIIYVCDPTPQAGENPNTSSGTRAIITRAGTGFANTNPNSGPNHLRTNGGIPLGSAVDYNGDPSNNDWRYRIADSGVVVPRIGTHSYYARVLTSSAFYTFWNGGTEWDRVGFILGSRAPYVHNEHRWYCYSERWESYSTYNYASFHSEAGDHTASSTTASAWRFQWIGNPPQWTVNFRNNPCAPAGVNNNFTPSNSLAGVLEFGRWIDICVHAYPRSNCQTGRYELWVRKQPANFPTTVNNTWVKVVDYSGLIGMQDAGGEPFTFNVNSYRSLLANPWSRAIILSKIWVGGNDSSFQEVTALLDSTPITIPAPVRLNCGTSNSFVDGSGNTWQGDAYFTGGVNSSTANPVSGTTDDTRYQTARTATSTNTIEYNIPMENGDYFVNLYFNDFGSSQSGQVVFNVDIGSNRVLSNFDPFSLVGSNTALQESFSYTVNNGNLNILFSDVSGLPKFITDIEIVDQTPVQDVVFTPSGGNFEVEETVSMFTPTSGATIRFTDDGTDPTTSGTAITYSGPVTINTTKTFKAYAFKIGYLDSNITEATFTLVVPTGLAKFSFDPPYAKIINENWQYRKLNKLLFIFSERNGTKLKDLSVAKRVGTITAGTWSLTDKGYALGFNGSTSKIIVPHSTDLNFGTSSFTLEMMIKPTDLSDSPINTNAAARAIYSKYQSSSDRVYIRIRNTSYLQMFWVIGGTSNFIDISLTQLFTNNIWNHVVFSLNRVNNTAYVYINGRFAGSATKVITGDNISNTGDVGIGLRDNSDNFFNGQIQKVSFIKGVALIGIQAQDLYYKQYPEFINPNSFGFLNAKFLFQTTNSAKTVSNTLSISGSLSKTAIFLTNISNSLGLSGLANGLLNTIVRFISIQNTLSLSSLLDKINNFKKNILNSLVISSNSMNKIFFTISNNFNFVSSVVDRTVATPIINYFNSISSSIKSRLRRLKRRG